MKKVIFIILIHFLNFDLWCQDSVTFKNLLANAVQLPNQVNDGFAYHYDLTNQNFIFDLDVYGYYDLYDKYDTELKKSVFEKTKEYNDKLNDLKQLKIKLLGTDLYFHLDKLFVNCDYSLQKKGFTLDISGLINNYYNTIYSIRLNALKNSIFISCNEVNGLEIENNREKINAYFFFRLDGVYKDERYGNILKSDRFQLFIVNSETQKIYYDKIFNYTKK